MSKLKKLFGFLLVLFSITFFIASMVYADESLNNSTQNVIAGSIIGEKVDIITLQTGGLFGTINGKKIKLDSPVTNTDKQMLVPLKFITEALGGKYTWNAKSKTLTITKKNTKIIYQLNRKIALINNKKFILDKSPVSIKNIILVPLKITAESLEAKFEWNSKLKTSIIKLTTKTIKFPDTYLEDIIRSQIKKPSGVLLLSDVTNINYLNLNDSKVSDLSGLQFMSDLYGISLSNTNVSDLTPVSGLLKLQSLLVPNNKIKDISPLGNLSSLTYLDLSNNQVSDISVLSKLKKLKTVKLWDSGSVEEITRIYQLAKEIVASIIKPDMSELEKELALHDYLVTHTRYDKENYDKNSIPPEDHHAFGVLNNKVGVCDGYAEAMQILLNLCGIECVVVIGDTLGPKDPGYEDYGHAWNIVKIDGVYYQLDPTFDDPTSNIINPSTTTSKDKLYHTYFNVSDKQLSLDHTWDRSQYPACATDSIDFNSSLEENKDTIITENWIYKIFKEHLYRFKPNESTVEEICSDTLYYISLSNDYIFYLNKDDNSKIYRIKTDGSEKTKIIDEFSLFPLAVGDNLYYIDKVSSVLLKANLDGSLRTQLSLNAYTSYLNIYDGWLYYRAFDWSINSKYYKVKIDFTNRITVIEEPLAGYDLSSDGRSVNFYYGTFEKMTKDWVFYLSKSNGNKIFKVKNDGTEKLQLNDADSSEIEVCGSWVYYINNSDGKYYRVKTDGSNVSVLVG